MQWLTALPVLAFAFFLTGSVGAASVDPTGVVVVAAEDESALAEPLARAVYAKESLRPRLAESEVDRLLGGDLGASLKAPRDLSAYLTAHALKGAVVVDRLEAGPRARLFLAKTSAYELAPLPAPESGDNAAAIRRIETALSSGSIDGKGPESKKAFYESYWFWGAVSGAALIGLVAVAATAKTDEPDRSHLVLRFP